MGHWNVRALVGAAVFGCIAGVFLWTALSYPLGTAQRMGPGFYPVLIAVLALALTVLMLLTAGREPYSEGSGRPAWRPLLAVLASLGTFAAVVKPFGLVPAVCLMVLVSALAERPRRPVRTVALAVGAAAGAWLVFVWGLRLQMTAFGSLL